MPQRDTPPLSVDEALRILGRLSDLVGDDAIVLIGGAALSIWHARLSSDPPEPQLATSDLDMQGGPDAVRLAAQLLGGEYRVTSFDEHTTQTGAVAFRDSTGQGRVIDFLRHPYGLDPERVEARAIPLDIDVGGLQTVRVAVMNPIDCMRSRIANGALPGREPGHAEAQLRASIGLVRAYARQLLDQGIPSREVMKLNEEVYEIALDDRRAKKLYRECGIDVADAALDDERLPAAHRETRLPQLRARLAKQR
jgi:hypothetical protein